MDNKLGVEEARTRLIYGLSLVTGFKYLKSGVLKKKIQDIEFEVNFFSSKWNTTGETVEIMAELSLIYKKYGKLPIDNVVAFISYQPTSGYWYDISTESKLLDTMKILEESLRDTAIDLVSRFEADYTAAVQYLFLTGFEKYHVHLDFVADVLGQTAIEDKAQQIYDELTNDEKEQVAQYQNGARNKPWMINRCNLKYIADNNLFQ